MIWCAAVCNTVNDPDFPKEWVYDDNDEPTCKAWIKWDWGNDGDLNDRHNPKAPVPDDPNQLCLPFMIDEIEQNIKLVKQSTYETSNLSMAGRAC